MEIVETCPLGSTCEKCVDDHIERCAWYTRITGKNPQTGEYEDQWKCAMAWQPILLVENSRQTRSTAAAIESFRNETTRQQQNAIGVLRDAAALTHN